MRAESKNPIRNTVFVIPNGQRARVGDFARFLRSVAGSAATTPPPDPAGFSDEMGHRRPVDGPFLAWRNRTESASIAASGGGFAPLDVALWSHLGGAPVDVGAVLEAHRPPPTGFGALMDQTSVRTIEVWTETELCSLHALSWIAMRDGDQALAGRVIDAARWHIAHMQPDNATNHPWSAHVFAMVDAIDDSREAGLYAQTLVHNCRTSLGRPDRVSAQILVDGAHALETALAP